MDQHEALCYALLFLDVLSRSKDRLHYPSLLSTFTFDLDVVPYGQGIPTNVLLILILI